MNNKDLQPLTKLLDESLSAEAEAATAMAESLKPTVTMTLQNSPASLRRVGERLLMIDWDDVRDWWLDVQVTVEMWPLWVRVAAASAGGMVLLGLLSLLAGWSSDRVVLASENRLIYFATVTPTLDPSYPQLGQNQPSQPLEMTLVPPTATPYPHYEGANEMAELLILEYHRIGYPDIRYQRSPDHFRADLQRLYDEGYYPVNFAEVLDGLPNVPPGKKPVVLTFDDSDISQFRVLDNHTIDADTAVGIMLDFHYAHPTDWPMRGTFFVLGDDRSGYRSIFGQPKWAEAKLNFLIEQGMEVGSHTVTHADLGVTTAERIQWELAVSQHVIEELLPGYQVQSLSVPFGSFPYSLDFLKSGQWGDYSYHHRGAVAAWGGPTVSPHHPDFNPYKVSRLEVVDDFFDYWLTHFQTTPYYTSDGDPTRLTHP